MQFWICYAYRREVSDEEIIQNGKNWMNKEVMLAFDKYKERSANLKVSMYNIEYFNC